MTKPLVILTGDDSVRAEGLILVKRMVEDIVDLKIVGTKEQQSAVGTKVNLRGGEWGTEVVDGVEAIWVDGSPIDAAQMSIQYFGRKPDLLISGMNIGENLTESMLISGTVSAAISAVIMKDVPAIAFSMIQPVEKHFMEHKGEIDEELLQYPGELIRQIVEKALKIGIPKGTFWNVNFPETFTDEIKIVKTAKHGYFKDGIQSEGNRFKYDGVRVTEGWSEDTDAGALLKGFATINPVKLQFTDFDEIGRLKFEF